MRSLSSLFLYFLDSVMLVGASGTLTNVAQHIVGCSLHGHSGVALKCSKKPEISTCSAIVKCAFSLSNLFFQNGQNCVTFF